MLLILIVAVVVGGLGVASGSWARGLAGVAAMLIVGGLVAAIALVVHDDQAERSGPYEVLARRPLVTAPGAGRPGRLARIVELSEQRAGDAHHLLRPVLAAVSEEWLLATHGIGLQDPAAGALLPTELWAWVRPDRPRPIDPHAPGLPAADLDRLLDQLEALP